MAFTHEVYSKMNVKQRAGSFDKARPWRYGVCIILMLKKNKTNVSVYLELKIKLKKFYNK